MNGVGYLGGWKWSFIIVKISAPILCVVAHNIQEDLMVVVALITAYFFVRNYPPTAKFLTPKEREHLVRLRKDSDAIRDEKFACWGGFPSDQIPEDLPPRTLLPYYKPDRIYPHPTVVNGLGYTTN